MSAKANKFSVVTPCESRYLELIRDFVAKIAKITGFDEEHVNKIQLSVDEACTNVVKHAYKGMDPKDIRVDVSFDKEKITIIVTDRGKGFNPDESKLKDMDDYLNQFRRGGLGIHLIKILMDEVNYSIDPNRKNRVKMVKYLREVESPEKKKKQQILMEKSYARHK